VTHLADETEVVAHQHQPAIPLCSTCSSAANSVSARQPWLCKGLVEPLAGVAHTKQHYTTCTTGQCDM
jgi:hypothetical protein